MTVDLPGGQGASDFQPLADEALSRWADQPGGPGPCPAGLDGLASGGLEGRLASDMRVHLLGCPACYREVAYRQETGVAREASPVAAAPLRAPAQTDLEPAMPALVERWVDLVVTGERKQRESASLAGVRRTLEQLERRRWNQAVAQAHSLVRRSSGAEHQVTAQAGRVLGAAALLGTGEWAGALSAFDGLLAQGGGERRPLLEVGRALASAGAAAGSRQADIGALRRRLDVLARSIGRGQDPGRGLG